MGSHAYFASDGEEGNDHLLSLELKALILGLVMSFVRTDRIRRRIMMQAVCNKFSVTNLVVVHSLLSDSMAMAAATNYFGTSIPDLRILARLGNHFLRLSRAPYPPLVA